MLYSVLGVTSSISACCLLVHRSAFIICPDSVLHTPLQLTALLLCLLATSYLYTPALQFCVHSSHSVPPFSFSFLHRTTAFVLAVSQPSPFTTSLPLTKQVHLSLIKHRFFVCYFFSMHRGVFSFRAFVIACIHCMVVKQTLQVFIPLFAPVLSAGRGKQALPQ